MFRGRMVKVCCYILNAQADKFVTKDARFSLFHGLFHSYFFVLFRFGFSRSLTAVIKSILIPQVGVALLRGPLTRRQRPSRPRYRRKLALIIEGVLQRRLWLLLRWRLDHGLEHISLLCRREAHQKTPCHQETPCHRDNDRQETPHFRAKRYENPHQPTRQKSGYVGKKKNATQNILKTIVKNRALRS